MLRWFLIAILNGNILIHFAVNDLSSPLRSALPLCRDRLSARLWIGLAARLIPSLSSSLPYTDSIVLHQYSLQPWEISDLEDMRKCFILFGGLQR